MTEESAQGASPEFEVRAKIRKKTSPLGALLIFVPGLNLRIMEPMGHVTIADGRLTLRRRKGAVMAEAPVSEVRAESARFAASVWIGDEQYVIEPSGGVRFANTSLGGAAVNVASDISQLKKGKELTQVLLAALEAAGAEVGGAGSAAGKSGAATQ